MTQAPFKPNYGARLKSIAAGLKDTGLGALLVTDIKNIRYLTGFTGGCGCLVLNSGGEGVFLTDTRYETQASLEVKIRGIKLKIHRGKSLLEEAAQVINRLLKPGATGFESESLSYRDYLRVKAALKRARLKPTEAVVRKARLRKDPFEIRRIKEAASIIDRAFALAPRVLKPGVIEKDAADEFEFAAKRNGADFFAFEPIVASGQRGALPHGKASSKRIKKGDIVIVDMGVSFRGYNSDETRTYSVGAPTRLQKKIYRVVKEAGLLAIEKIGPGVKAHVVDGVARGFIKKAGYGKYFGHALGHGVGLDVHEGPALSPVSKDVLEEGMVVTVEPGIYIPGWGGVRIEDMVIVKKGGAEVITKTPKELFSL